MKKSILKKAVSLISAAVMAVTISVSSFSTLAVTRNYSVLLNDPVTEEEPDNYDTFEDDLEENVSASVGAATLSAAVGNGKVTLSWTSVAGATKYRLQRYNAASGVWATIATTTSRSYTDTSVTNGTAYKYRVYAYVGTEIGGVSNIVTATPTLTVGAATLSGTAGVGNVTLSWTKVTDATKYRIQRCAGSSTTWTTVANTTGTSYTDTNVTSGTAYKYRVFAYVGTVIGGASNVVSVTPLASIGKSTVTATAKSNCIEVSFTEVDGATKYRLQKWDDVSCAWKTLTYFDDADCYYVDFYVEDGVTYKYRIFAYVGSTMGPSSNVATAKYLVSNAKTTLLGAAGVGMVSLRWDTTDGAEKYRIQRRESSSGSWATIAYATGLEWDYIDYNVKAGTEYQYRVFPYINSIMGSSSNIVTLTPSSADSVGTVVLATEIQNDEYGTSINLNWTEVSGATAYIVERWDEKTNVWKVLCSYWGPGCDLCYYDYDILQGVTYKYRVYACKGEAMGKASNVSSLKIDVTSLAAPKFYECDIFEEGYRSLSVDWNDEENDGIERAYRLQKYDDTAKVWKTVANTKEKSYIDSDIVIGQTYKYRVFAYSGSILSPASEVYTIKVPVGSPSYFLYEYTENGIQLSWGYVNGADRFRIQRYNSSSKKWETIAWTTERSYVDTNANINQKNGYRVYAYAGSTISDSYKELWTDV